MMSRRSAQERNALVVPSDEDLRRTGARLREARLARGEELLDAASWLRIKPSFLVALEEGDEAATPGRVYAKGFLRAYGEHLGLDGAALAAGFDRALGTDGRRCNARRPRPARHWLSDATAVVALLMLAALGGGAYLALGGWGTALPLPSAQPSHADGASASAAEATPIAALVSADGEIGARALSSSPATGRVILVARGSGWVQLTDATGDFVRSWPIGPGDWIPVPPRRGLALSTDDAGSVEILVDGRSIGTAGPESTVLRGLALDPEALLTRMSTR